jgi:hypothetical protein
MSVSSVLALTAMIAAIVLLLLRAHRSLALVALAVSGVEVILAFGIVHFSVRGLSLNLVFGAALAIVGALMYRPAHRKSAVTAATLIVFVGIVQVLGALR